MACVIVDWGFVALLSPVQVQVAFAAGAERHLQRCARLNAIHRDIRIGA